MEMKKDVVSWFEIPVIDFERAQSFYSTVLDTKVENHEMPEPNVKYGVFQYDHETAVGGAIMQMEGFKPSAEGVVIYLNGGKDLSEPLSRVESAGGKIVMPKTDIGENGFIAQFIDPEGNRIALHSMN